MSTEGDRKPRRTFSPQFKAEAVAMVVELGKTGAEVARDLDLNQSTVQRWVARWRREHGGGAGGAGVVESARLAELEAANRRLEQENSFLKKAAAFFARELPQG
ncbi:MAG: transposase [Bifidobacteriaceae bacterium]|jgi:transposase-like protein|nr:transposase [Bifidobacteriaceae bacterium]